nr:hypothetical protein [Tanacetum cinerariifolium]
MEQPNPTFAKIPILDTGKFKQWKFRIQQYLQNEHYALWEVIEFSDSYQAPPKESGTGSTSKSCAKKKGRTVAITTEDMQKRRNDVKARTTLLLALSDEHRLRFSKYETAQELWGAILKTFGGNEATKKTKKNQLKQQHSNFKAKGSETLEKTFNRLQAIVSHLEFMGVDIKQDDLNQKFLTSLAPEWLMYTIVWRNRDDLDTLSLDDVYNHLKVYEPEVQKKSESNSQNMAFISSANTSSRKGKINTASIPTTSTQVSTASVDVAAASISHDTVCAYIASQSNGSQIKYEDINQIDEDDIEEMDIKWNMALLTDEEALTEFALMAKSSSSSENKGISQNNIDDKGYWDSGCSRHMTGNISYLSDYEPYDGGYVSFRQGGGKITGKGIIKTDFKLKDDTNVLLRTPRQHNMYSIDINNIVPHKDLTCLVAKASADESMLWHRRLGHLNFKTMNKLVRHNVVKGLPSKCFENDHTCVACLKGKQHKASYKTKLVNSVSKPFHTLHMDLFRPTSDSSLNYKWYCFVVTDDFSRFTWTFFLKTKDETSGILRNFITEIENLKDLKVNIIRVAKRRNRTLIEAARTMLADAKLPVTFWAEAVNTGCYVQNRVLVNKSHNKTSYELFNSRTPAIGFLKPFGCHVMILNTVDHLGKFDAKGDEGTSSTNILGTKDAASQGVKKDVSSLRYIALPNWFHEAHMESSNNVAQDACNADASKSSGISNPTATSKSPPAKQMESLTVEFAIPTVSSHVPTACLDNSPETSSPSRLISEEEEPKKIFDALKDLCWVEAMQEEFLQFKIQNVWILVNCPKGTIMATSTTEAEYVAAASGCEQVLWIQNQMLDYGHHFIRDCYEMKLINVDHIQTDDNVADLLTKPFDVGRFRYLVFCSTARIETTNEGTKILAVVDGKPKTISESSIRRNLKLNDEAGISTLPDAKLFENLALMGYNILSNQKFTFQKGKFSHQWKFLIHTIMQCLIPKSTGFNEFSSNIATAVGEGSGTPTEPHPTPSPQASQSPHHYFSSPSHLTATTKTIPTTTPIEIPTLRQYSKRATRIAHLKEKIKFLEDKDKGSAKLSGDDAPIKRRSMEIGEEAGVEKSIERGSNDTKELVNVLTSMDATNILTNEVQDVNVLPVAEVSTVGVPTASGLVPTVSAIFLIASVVTPYSRRPREISAIDKGKKKMVESDTLKKKKLQEQIDAQVAKDIEEEITRDNQNSLDRNNEVIERHLQEYEEYEAELTIGEKIELINELVKYQDYHVKILKYQAQQSKPLSKKEQREFYMSVLRSHAGWKTKHFKEEGERVKRKGLKLEQGSAKKMKTTDEVSEEDLKEMMQLVPVEEGRIVGNKMLKSFPLPVMKIPLLEYFPTASEEVFLLLSIRVALAEEVCTAGEVKD